MSCSVSYVIGLADTGSCSEVNNITGFRVPKVEIIFVMQLEIQYNFSEDLIFSKLMSVTRVSVTFFTCTGISQSGTGCKMWSETTLFY